MKQKFNVLIIGAGKVGAFFDSPETKQVLTHAHAFTKHHGFNLLGFTDTDVGKARKAAGIWKCRSFENIKDAFRSEKIDVVSVAVPDDCHFEVLRDLSGFPLRLVFAEKPLTKTAAEARKIMRLYGDKKKGVLVNYSRRFVPEFEKIRKDVEKGRYGKYLTGTGYYGKGILHNGSHLIDLLLYFIGEISTIMPVNSASDFYEEDQSISAVLRFENGGPFFLQYADCSKYTIFEIDMLFERRRIRICDLGLRVEEFKIQPSKAFRGYNNMVRTAEVNTSLNMALYNAARNIYGYLTGRQALKCTAEDGYRALETCIRIRESIRA